MAQSPCLDVDLVDVCDDCCDDTLTGMDPARADLIKRMALYYLWVATGRQFGLCERTFRPCRIDCRNLTGLYGPIYPSIPYRLNGDWFNLSCGKCPGSCGCDMVSEVFIQGTHSIVNIREDGIDYPDPVDIAAVYDYERIIRTDGMEWPACQNLSQVDGIGTWSITIMQGKDWPDGLGVVAGILACELAKACTGAPCRLPQRIQTITRQNVTIGFQDRFEGLALLHTGLWEVDAFIEATRFTGFGQASVVSPDWTSPAQLTWPLLGDGSPGSP